jgi:hypothetical protein
VYRTGTTLEHDAGTDEADPGEDAGDGLGGIHGGHRGDGGRRCPHDGEGAVAGHRTAQLTLEAEHEREAETDPDPGEKFGVGDGDGHPTTVVTPVPAIVDRAGVSPPDGGGTNAGRTNPRSTTSATSSCLSFLVDTDQATHPT